MRLARIEQVTEDVGRRLGGEVLRHLELDRALDVLRQLVAQKTEERRRCGDPQLPEALRRVCVHEVIAQAFGEAPGFLIAEAFARIGGMPLVALALAVEAWTTTWVALSLALYVLAGACWLPVVWMQVRMRDMAADAVAAGGPLPQRYWTYPRRWTMLGVPEFLALVAVFWLMIAKPS